MYWRWKARCAFFSRIVALCAMAATASACSFFKSDKPLIDDAMAASPFGRASAVTLRPDARDSADTITLVRSGRDYVAVGLPPENSVSLRFASIEGVSDFFVLQARIGPEIYYAGARIEAPLRRFAYLKSAATPNDTGPGLRECGSNICVDELAGFVTLLRREIAEGSPDEDAFTIEKTLDEPGTLNDGLLAVRRGDYLTAVTVLRPLAHFGSVSAQTTLGVMYYQGLGVSQNDEAAVAFFRNAAEQGDAQGQNNLGLMYEEGRGVEVDLREAIRWYELAAAQGHSIAKENLQEIRQLIARASAEEEVTPNTGQTGPDDQAGMRESDTAVHADLWLECDAGIDRDRTIAACTEVIEAPRTTSDRLALASRYRGEAHLAAAVAGSGDYFYDKAIADFTLAIRLSPVDAEAYTGRGRAYMRRAGSNADFAVALSDFSTAIRLAPDDPDRYVDRAELRRKMSDFAGAIADLRLALERLPRGDGGRAAIESRIRVFEAQIAANQGTAWRICTSGARSDETVSACTEYISTASAGDPRLAEVYAARAATLVARGDLDRAHGDYSAAIRIAPDSPAAYVGRGDVRAGQGEYRGAIADYSKAIDLQPDLADGYYGRGAANQAIGEFADALDDLQEAASLIRSPDDPRLADARSRIADIERDLRPPQIAEVPSEPQVDDKPDSALEAEYFGTGIVVSADGAILTNEHVIEECETYFVRRDQQSFEAADYVASNPANDLALLRTRRPIPERSVASIRVTPALRLGEPVAVFGFPLVGELSSQGNFVTGNVSALSGPGDDGRLLQVTAPVQSGNSGGPLMDSFANVVGVVQLKSNQLETGEIIQNANFAIKSEVAVRFLSGYGISVRQASGGEPLDLPDIADAARQYTVAIGCR